MKVFGGLTGGTIQAWDAASGLVLFTLCGHYMDVVSLKVINNYTLASGSLDSKIKLWNLINATSYLTLIGHTRTVTGLEYLSTGYLVRKFLRYSSME